MLVPDALSQVGQERVVRAFEQDATWPTTRRHLPVSSLLEGAEDARIERLKTLQVPPTLSSLAYDLPRSVCYGDGLQADLTAPIRL